MSPHVNSDPRMVNYAQSPATATHSTAKPKPHHGPSQGRWGLICQSQHSRHAQRQPGPSTVFAPASLAEVGDLLLIADHNILCRVVGSVKGYYVLVRSLRSGERFALPLNLQIELFNTPRR